MSTVKQKLGAQAEQAAANAPRQALPRMRVHFLIPAEDGPVVSGAKDSQIPLANKDQMPTHFVVACDASIVMSELDRGTGEPWCVRCDACMATKEFQERNRPKPGIRMAPTQRVATGRKDCRC